MIPYFGFSHSCLLGMPTSQCVSSITWFFSVLWCDSQHHRPQRLSSSPNNCCIRKTRNYVLVLSVRDPEGLPHAYTWSKFRFYQHNQWHVHHPCSIVWADYPPLNFIVMGRVLCPMNISLTRCPSPSSFATPYWESCSPVPSLSNGLCHLDWHAPQHLSLWSSSWCNQIHLRYLGKLQYTAPSIATALLRSNCISLNYYLWS